MTDLPRLCIFGDSHYACLRQAEAEGLADLSGVELEYWGHVGSGFRFLQVRDGAVHPGDDKVARSFARFNARRRLVLPAADFDGILVMGARVYVWRLFVAVLRALESGPFLSQGLMRRMLVDGFRCQVGYQVTAGLAATRTARIFLAPVAHYTENPAVLAELVTPGMQALIPYRLPEFWRILQAAAAEDGIELLPQPEETVTDGIFTKAEYAVADHLVKGDYEHRNARYGAVILSRVMPRARGLVRRG
jgi:hypothetical protein